MASEILSIMPFRVHWRASEEDSWIAVASRATRGEADEIMDKALKAEGGEVRLIEQQEIARRSA